MQNPHKHPWNPFSRNIKVFARSYEGWLYATRTDPGAMQWLLISLLLSPVAIAWGEGLEVPLMLASLWAIYVVELLNCTIEITLDRITTEHDLAVKAAKDIGSAAVFSTALIGLLVWGFCLFI